jgi:hypothetical protein
VDEEEMVQRVGETLAEHGLQEEVLAAGMFFPRGHTGSMFVGGFAGDTVGGAGGDLASSVGTVGGAIGAAKAHDAASGLPERVIVAVTPSAVLGFDSVRDHGRRPTEVVFNVARAGLTTKVHQRVNVRILELVDDATGASVQLEGSRVPTLHTGDVFKALRGR